eukprot:1160440-Pelagomonas_calceolata.AAC.7
MQPRNFFGGTSHSGAKPRDVQHFTLTFRQYSTAEEITWEGTGRGASAETTAIPDASQCHIR